MAERLPDAELRVMECLWERAPQSATEVHDRLRERIDWSLPTVKTLLARLVARGAARAEVDGRRHLYSPALSRDAVASVETRRIVDRLFGGRIAPLVAQFAEREKLTPDDLAELKALLGKLRK